MYCTGGIRCDVYSAALRQKGFKNLFTLHGGIQHYLREEGAEHWNGSLFVFDGRMAINPALQKGSEGKQHMLSARLC
jgi:predicted sulfurtransferase